ncbi:MAG: hypothetical protein ACRDL5_09055 [Solirubrobacteraceae bacterium]
MTSRRLAQWLKGGAQTFSLGPVRATITFAENAQYTRVHVPSLTRYNNLTTSSFRGRRSCMRRGS